MNKPFAIGAALVAFILALLPGLADAAKTNIAQVPLLNITGTGTVKPNLMLLFDNSGSMEYHYTPDYVNDYLCRSAETLAAGRTACGPGHPPFMSPDFNRQYYNPRIRYQPPVKWDGTFHQNQTSARTSAWTSVVTDGFGQQNKDLYQDAATSTDLINDFPDLKWCHPDDSSDCKVNTNYRYPDKTYTDARSLSGAPYYYNIIVSEYCTDETLKKCVSTVPGAPAPKGYPVGAKVRWCDRTTLGNCQAKQTGAFKYPKFSTPLVSSLAYGTLTIGASGTGGSLQIASVSVRNPASGDTYVISDSAMVAPEGTNDAAKRARMASTVAASIIAKDASSAPEAAYWACVRTPKLASVTACSALGITLPSDDMVAVLPIKCAAGPKDMVNCQILPADLAQNPRLDWMVLADPITVRPAPERFWPATAILDVEGTKTSKGSAITSIRLGSVSLLLSGHGAMGRNYDAEDVAAKIKAEINAAQVSGVTAYVGGDAGNRLCANLDRSFVCVADVNGAKNVTFTVTGNNAMGSIDLTRTTASNTAPDAIAYSATSLSSSASVSSFVRVDLRSGQNYPKAPTRTDCAGTSCTYDEEMTNFANWYSYYKSRLQMMKSAVGLAFAQLNANYRVGYAKLSEAAAGAAMAMKPSDFTGTSRSDFYTKLYNTTSSGSTPSRPALDNVGRMFANKTPYEYEAGKEVVQFPCQQNFTLFTTDGYWNGGSTDNVVNNDNTESASRFCTKASGCYDGREQDAPSLADVALHWYNGGSSTATVSLRGDALEKDMKVPGKVPAAPGENTHLHMNTFTLGLGMDGIMTFEPNYASDAKVGGDYYNIIHGVQTGCPWNDNGPWVWPDPQVGSSSNTVQARVDDLWHAAVNGRGLYFSANEPNEVVEGLAAALGKMEQTVGAASSAATSTPNISLEDNDIFSDTFTTVQWYGELADRKINTTNGEVSKDPVWTTTATLGKSVAAASDSRTIYKVDEGGEMEDFTYENLSTLEKTWFDSKCLSLPQCVLLTAEDRAKVDSGANLLNWLRGQQQHADGNIFRSYSMTKFTPAGSTGPIPIVLGDIASSKPAYLREPRKSYTTAGYSTYKSDNAKRPATVFTAANDGMLHAFNAANGQERYAYVPRITMKKMWNLASTTYATNHIFITDGSPELGDVVINGKWRTVLVAGLNGGGRGFYALDVTESDKGTVTPLWELCADASICARNDADIGLTFGNPQFGMWQNKWVVFLTSGYNNVPGVEGVNGGSGKGYLFIVDVATGEVLKKVTTNSGDTDTPSGLAKITAISDDPASDPVITYIYGGDNNGKLWRFDLTDPEGAVSVLNMADAGLTQPITARPDVTLCAVKQADGTVRAQRVVLFGTGRLLDVPDTENEDVQSLYVFKDKGEKVELRGATMAAQTLVSAGENTHTYSIKEDAINLKDKNGWYFDWKLNAGERMNLDPKIVSGVANIVTNTPTSETSCSVGGTSNYYGVDVCHATGVNSKEVGATLSNTSAAVGFIVVRLPKGELKMITTTAKGEMIPKPIKELKSAEAHPVGWRRVKGD